MIYVSETTSLDEKELSFSFIKASGPGGQNVNKVSTAVQLRFNVNSPSLNSRVRYKLKEIASNRINSEGVLIIDARSFRTQEKNKSEAIKRLVDLIKKAAFKPKFRVKTKPSKGSVRRRLDSKKKRGQTKKMRSSKPGLD